MADHDTGTAGPPSRDPLDGAMQAFTTSLVEELRAIAMRQLAGQRDAVLLQPTALVNEAWAKLAQADALNVRDRTHAKARAAKAMRQVMIDAIRQGRSLKRGGGRDQVLLGASQVSSDEDPVGHVEALAVHEALEKFARIDPRAAEVVELRFFGGLDWEEIGAWLGVTERTARTDWAQARAWMAVELSRAD